MPAPLHRRLYQLAWWARVAWWRVRRPTVHGCRIVARDDAGRVLLIRQTYGLAHWTLPAGGLARGENPVEAARRELAEETCCVLVDARLVRTVDERLHGATNRVHVVLGATASTPVPDGREVAMARFFALGDLPQDISPRVLEGLADWIAGA